MTNIRWIVEKTQANNKHSLYTRMSSSSNTGILSLQLNNVSFEKTHTQTSTEEDSEDDPNSGHIMQKVQVQDWFSVFVSVS